MGADAIYDVFHRVSGDFAGSGTALIDDATYRSVLSSPASKDGLKAYAAARRWDLQEGGMTLAGLTVRTDKASRDMIGDACALAERQPGEPIRFKAVSGWVGLDAPAMIAIGVAVGAHVRGLFQAEYDISGEIDAGEITTAAQIDAAFGALAG